MTLYVIHALAGLFGFLPPSSAHHVRHGGAARLRNSLRPRRALAIARAIAR